MPIVNGRHLPYPKNHPQGKKQPNMRDQMREMAAAGRFKKSKKKQGA